MANLMCAAHKVSTKEYREEYDRIFRKNKRKSSKNSDEKNRR